MKALFIILLIWIITIVIVFGIQVLFNTGDDRDQTTTPWKEMIKQSVLWPWELLKIIVRR